MKKIKVSICVPVYNAGKYLKECLESLVNQTLNDLEIICVNDGSTDDSLEILENYSKKHKNFHVYNQENQGVISARINAYKKAKGEYIGWVDADDFIDKTMFERLYNEAKKIGADVSYCDYNFYPNKVVNKEKWYKRYKGKIDYSFIAKNTVQWNKIVSKKLLDKLKICDLFEKLGEGCYSLVLINANKIVSIDEKLYNYRVGQSSLSSNFSNINWYKKVVERAKNKAEFVKENEYNDYWIKVFEYVYLYYVMILLIVSAYNDNKEQYNESKCILKNNSYFSKQNSEFLNNDLSKAKIIFIKYIGMNNFYLFKKTVKLILKK